MELLRFLLLTMCHLLTTESANSTIDQQVTAQTTPLLHSNEHILQILKELQTEFTSFKQSFQNEFSTFKKSVGALSRQVMLQQLFVEERIRSDGDSGIKIIRNRYYATKSHSGYSVGVIHDHTGLDRTLGMGEIIGVLNGVEFRTRHNDYNLSMPSTSKKDYNAVEDIQFPPVPPSVLNKHTVHEQIAEMREYFKAFHDQDEHRRDWKPYFKPALCYLEGGWTTTTKTLEEPFSSERHIQDGSENGLDNDSYLPTTIVNVTDKGEPVYAQWNYRILCHPVQTQLHLRDFNLVDDLANRMRLRKNITAFGQSRSARFKIAPYACGTYDTEQGYLDCPDRSLRYEMLDKIMNEIPGKDNYEAYLTDDDFDLQKYRIETKNLTVLNVAYYHKVYKVTGQWGNNIRRRGFNDNNMFVAKTTNPKIVNMELENCKTNQTTHKMECHKFDARYTYAIPLEIIWMTPLSQWNPYNLTVYKNNRDFHKITDGARDGGHTKEKAYNGTTTSNYYITPSEFFHGDEVDKDPADTAKDTVGVLDQQGEVRTMSAAGYRVFFPEIPGVGIIRQRYPIMPVYAERRR